MGFEPSSVSYSDGEHKKQTVFPTVEKWVLKLLVIISIRMI